MRLPGLFLTTALLCLAVDASAQGDPRQTPENANKFLVLNLANSELTGDGNFTGYLKLRTGGVSEGGDACKISIGYSGERNYMNRTGDQTVYTDVFILDFQNVKSIERVGSRLDLSYPIVIDGSMMNTVRLGQPSEDIATRVAYAMNFLKSHCNPADQTGF